MLCLVVYVFISVLNKNAICFYIMSAIRDSLPSGCFRGRNWSASAVMYVVNTFVNIFMVSVLLYYNFTRCSL